MSLEEALLRLAEFLSVQLGAEESCGSPADLGQVSAAEGAAGRYYLRRPSWLSQPCSDSCLLRSLARSPHC